MNNKANLVGGGMIYRCEFSENQKHTWFETRKKTMVVLTCLTCGHKRAVTDEGNLMAWNEENGWNLVPPTPLKEKTEE